MKHHLPETHPAPGYRTSDIVHLRDEAADVPRLVREGTEGLPDVDYKVAVVVPGTALSLESCAALERAGYLVVEVPTDVASSPLAAIAEHLNRELQAGVAHTAARMDALQRRRYEPEPVDEDADLTLSEEEEADALEAFNDPVGSTGGCG